MRFQHRHQIRRVFAAQHRVEEAAVEQQIAVVRGFHVRRILRARIGRRQVQHDANLTGIMPGAEGANRLRMGQHRVIGHGRRATEIDHVRVVEVIQIPALYRHNRLVKGKPVHDPIAKKLKAGFCVAGISRDHITVFPPANLLHRHRHVEVEQGDKRLDALGKQFVDHLIVESHRFLVHFTGAFRDEARPAYRGAKAIVVQLL